MSEFAPRSIAIPRRLQPRRLQIRTPPDPAPPEAWSRMGTPLPSLLDAFARIDDPRQPRGVRHPFTSILALAFLGLLCRETDLACLQRGTRTTGGSSEAPWASPGRGRPTPRPSAAPWCGSRSSSSATPSRGGRRSAARRSRCADRTGLEARRRRCLTSATSAAGHRNARAGSPASARGVVPPLRQSNVGARHAAQIAMMCRCRKDAPPSVDALRSAWGTVRASAGQA